MSDRAVMPGSQSSLREANRGRILDALAHYGAITQVEIAEVTGLSPATVSTIVKQMLQAGDVETRTTVRSGRRAQLVRPAVRTGLAVGIHVGTRSLRVLVGDRSYTGLGEHTLPLPRFHRADTTLDRAALLVVDLVERVGVDLEELVGIVVALPAPVDPRTGLVSGRGIMSGWEDVPIREVFERRLGVPTGVENDATAGAIAEHRFGAGRGCRDLAYVRVSHATGAAVILGGEVHRGRRGIGGEIGHVEVDPVGTMCTCGSRGCLNTVVGADALEELLRISRPGITLSDIIALALEGDPGCRQVIADAGAQIGSVSGGLALAFDPERLVVGGELAQTGELLLSPLRDAIERRVPLSSDGGVDVRAAELGVRAEVVGAMVMAFDGENARVRHGGSGLSGPRDGAQGLERGTSA